MRNESKKNDNIVLETINLSKSFSFKKQEFKALDNVSLSIKQGEIFGIMGQSGAGKSTLLRCLNLLERPTSGSVVFDNQDIAALKERQLPRIRGQFGMIFQSFNLFMQRTVLKNVYFPLEIAKNKNEQTKARALELLELVGILDKKDAYPKTLSGGQKQRVAIARALINNPKILLCDEPTSALDSSCANGILRLLKHINKEFGITIVIITHDLHIAKQICDRVAVIEGGRIVQIREGQDV